MATRIDSADVSVFVISYGYVNGATHGAIYGCQRPPTLHEAQEVLAQAALADCRCVEWYERVYRKTILRRCDCGNVAFDDVCCRWCRAAATLLVSQDEESRDDLQARYESAERESTRLAIIAAMLKERSQ